MRRLAFCACLGMLLQATNSSIASIRVDEIRVSIRLLSPDLPEDATVCITGAGSALGNWKPDAKRMTYAGDHEWTFELIAEAQTIEYKYTLGSWAIEGADATGKPLQNLTKVIQASTTIEDRIDFWTKPRQRETLGQITGTARYHRQLSAEGVRARDVVVWLPPNYEQSDERYPVLYMHVAQRLPSKNKASHVEVG